MGVSAIARMIELYRPTVIVLEDCAGKDSVRCHAIKAFIRKISKLADKRKIPVRMFFSSQVRETFSRRGATTKHQIAIKITEQFPELVSWLPRRRELGMNEDYRMNIFDAVALAVTFLDVGK